MIPQEAIHQLRRAKEMLSKKQEDLREEIEQQIMIAKMNCMKNKRAALQALKKKKKHLEQQLIRIDRVLSITEFQLEALENANTNTEVLNNMSMAAKAIKEFHETMDMDNIVSLMDGITEGKEIVEEISNVISQPFDDGFDEDETLTELEVLVHKDMGNMGRFRRLSTRQSHPAEKKTSSTAKEPSYKAKGIHRKLARRRSEGDIILREMNLRKFYLYTTFILFLCFCILIFFYSKTSINEALTLKV